MAFFSVIISLFNKEKYIVNTLHSALNQTFKDFEIIIVDDGSTDNSYQLVSEVSDSRIVVLHQKNKGVSGARNRGVKHANSRYIVLLDADDLWKSNHLEELCKCIHAFPEADLYCNNYEINYNTKIIRPAIHNFEYKKEPFLIDNFFTASKYNPITYPSSACLKKETLLEIGLFNRLYDSAEDLDVWIKMGLRYNIVFNPVITMTYSGYIADSLSNSNHNLNQYRLFSSLKDQETYNTDLKNFINMKRYGLALRCKLNRDEDIYSKTIKDIDFNDLTFKQKTLLTVPYSLILPLNYLRTFMLNNSLYLTLFK